MKNGFLFRRLARLIPCVLPAVGSGSLYIKSKYQIASLRDVFLSANYWRLYDHIQHQPSIVIDLGANCGHFTILMHLLSIEKFKSDQAQYFLVEPVSDLVRCIQESISEVGLSSQATILEGVVGGKAGEMTGLQLNARNMLTTSVSNEVSSGPRLKYLDPLSFIPNDSVIDVLKVDIEGSEYDLLKSSPDLFKRARVLAVELHGAKELQESFLSEVATLGFESRSTPIECGPASMHILINSGV